MTLGDRDAGRTADWAVGEGVSNVPRDAKVIHAKKTLPGVVIFVHGVNTDGEWYERAEQGLCAGLNTRLRREDANVAVPDAVGQLRPAKYATELTPRGFIDDRLSAKTFVEDDEDSPVIRFRWGYRASKEDKEKYGTSLWLDEKDAWGGGPFANGCSTLADCWTGGLSDEVFGFWISQDFNATPGREFYSLPSRVYYAHAASRLALLVQLIRKRQPDVPVTIIGHSQGTMVTIASAFIGDKTLGGEGVADTYLLFNSPYNLGLPQLLPRLIDRNLAKHLGGRVTDRARIATFKRFLDIVRKRQQVRQKDTTFDRVCGNAAPRDGSEPCTAAAERVAGRDMRGKVVTNSNPADQLIGVVSLQGIGWRGITREECRAIGAEGVLSQRVWADGFASDLGTPDPWKVGEGGLRTYHYWKNHWARPRPGVDPFWYPPSAPVRFVWSAAWTDPGRSKGEAIAATGTALLATVVTLFTVVVPPLLLLGIDVNASPDRGHEVLDDGSAVPEPIVPTARHGRRFDHGKARAHELLAPSDVFEDENDPYNVARRKTVPGLERDAVRDEDREIGWAPHEGDAQTEAGLRYEHNGRARLAARRRALTTADADEKERWKDMADRYDGKDAEANAFMAEHFDAERIASLARGKNVNSVDHSTILDNAVHAEKVVAYDVALGYVKVAKDEMRLFRQVADWRWIPDPNGDAALKTLTEHREYYRVGTLGEKDLEKHPSYQPEVPLDLGIACDRSAVQPTPSSRGSRNRGGGVVDRGFRVRGNE
jgi:hypothetical protein